MERMVPSCYWKLFEPMAIIPLADSDADADAMVEEDMIDYGPDTERRNAAIRNRALVSPYFCQLSFPIPQYPSVFFFIVFRTS